MSGGRWSVVWDWSLVVICEIPPTTDYRPPFTDHRPPTMNCEYCQLNLADFLADELASADLAALREHLSVCVDCRQAQAVIVRENEIFAQFYEQNAIAPPDEMWSAIHARIHSEDAAPTPSKSGWANNLRNLFAPLFAPAMLRQFGFAALLILLSVGLTTLYFSTRNDGKIVVETRPTPSPNATAALSEAPKPPEKIVPKQRSNSQLVRLNAAALKFEVKKSVPQKLSDSELLNQQIAKATREYQGAIKLLERTIANRKTDFDEGASKQYEDSLALIDASIAASKQALRQQPNDPSAAKFLLAAYSKKVELMQEVAMR